MSRNHTQYHLVIRDECGYWDCLRTVRTFDQARRAFAVTGAERIDKWRCTPSKSSFQEVYPGKERVQPLRRVVRKHYRREADARKREQLDAIWFVTIPCGERVARRMSVRQFSRYLVGVRRGTIL